MAENPLLPDRKLQELYALIERCRALDRKVKSGAAARPRRVAREAWLAATTMHLQPGDVLCAEPGDSTAAQLGPGVEPEPGAGSAAKSTETGNGLLVPPVGSSRLLLCAAAAGALRAAGSAGVVLAFATTGPERAGNGGWAEALEWAQRSQLPLLLACMDSRPGGGARRGNAAGSPKAGAPLSRASMDGLARRLKLPVLPVDAEDAVAVYRVMQESALRARMGGGPAVLWAVTPAGSDSTERANQPLARLRSYLKTRGIALP